VTEQDPRNIIGFRLDPEYGRALAIRAAALEISQHALAKQYVMDCLTEPVERVALRDAIDHLHGELSRLRVDFGLAVQALLVSAGTVDEASALKWVEQNFRRA